MLSFAETRRQIDTNFNGGSGTSSLKMVAAPVGDRAQDDIPSGGIPISRVKSYAYIHTKCPCVQIISLPRCIDTITALHPDEILKRQIFQIRSDVEPTAIRPARLGARRQESWRFDAVAGHRHPLVLGARGEGERESLLFLESAWYAEFRGGVTIGRYAPRLPHAERTTSIARVGR